MTEHLFDLENAKIGNAPSNDNDIAHERIQLKKQEILDMIELYGAKWLLAVVVSSLMIRTAEMPSKELEKQILKFMATTISAHNYLLNLKPDELESEINNAVKAIISHLVRGLCVNTMPSNIEEALSEADKITKELIETL